MAEVMVFCRSTVGKKVLMAANGLVLFLFLIGHLLGNLLIFVGREQLNAYAAFLKRTEELLWAARLILLGALALHILASLQITLVNWKARPIDYVVKQDVETGYAARTMIVSGPLVFLYVVYHLLMFTFLTTGPGYSETDVYRNVVLAFQVPIISGVYILALLVLGMHLYHGVWSMFQSLGLEWSRSRRTIATLAVVAIAGGYSLIPLAVLTGVLR